MFVITGLGGVVIVTVPTWAGKEDGVLAVTSGAFVLKTAVSPFTPCVSGMVIPAIALWRPLL